MDNQSQKNQIILGILSIIGIAALVIWTIASFVSWFTSLDSDLAKTMLTASSTIIVATVTVMLGRYFERVKETEAHLRTQKIELYDEILTKLFSVFPRFQRRQQESRPRSVYARMAKKAYRLGRPKCA